MAQTSFNNAAVLYDQTGAAHKGYLLPHHHHHHHIPAALRLQTSAQIENFILVSYAHPEQLTQTLAFL